MKRIFAALFIGAVFLSPAVAQAQINHFVGPNGVDPVPVSAANPMPVTGASGGPITVANGANVVEGSQNDAAACPSGTAKTIAGCLAQIHADAIAAVPACSASPCVTVIGLTSNDPCTQLSKSGAPISLTGSGQIITGTSAKKTYICSIDLVSATAQNIALVEGTGSTCATNIFGLAGGTTAATGWNLAANGGLSKGSGDGTVYSPSADSNGAAANVCLLLSGSGQTSGQITYVQQ